MIDDYEWDSVSGLNSPKAIIKKEKTKKENEIKPIV